MWSTAGCESEGARRPQSAINYRSGPGQDRCHGEREDVGPRGGTKISEERFTTLSWWENKKSGWHFTGKEQTGPLWPYCHRRKVICSGWRGGVCRYLGHNLLSEFSPLNKSHPSSIWLLSDFHFWGKRRDFCPRHGASAPSGPDLFESQFLAANPLQEDAETTSESTGKHLC